MAPASAMSCNGTNHKWKQVKRISGYLAFERPDGGNLIRVPARVLKCGCKARRCEFYRNKKWFLSYVRVWE